MKGKLKRLLGTVLACVMVFALLPASALAAEEMAETEIAAEEETVVPTEDAEVTEPEGLEESTEATEPEAPAEAAEEDLETDAAAPTITGLSVNGITANADRGNLYVGLPIDTELAGKPFALTTSEAVTFTATTGGVIGELYVSAVSGNTVTLTLAVGVTANSDYSMTMTSTDGVNWSGSFSSSFGMDAGTLADAVAMAELSLRAGSMVNAANVGNEAVQVLGNQDLNSAWLVLCAPDQAVSTVTYVISGSVHTWQLPTGAILPEPVFTTEGQEPEGWYYDSDYTQPVVFENTTLVTGDVTLYAKTADVPTEGAFLTAFAAQDEELPIYNNADWAAFIEKAADISTNQRVELMADIDCGGVTYNALTFAGDFNGNNFTISNASFNAVDGNSGMFASIGPGQKVCNLVLDNVTAKTANTYAGVLAGQIAGTEGSRALVQNVQVKNSSATGRSAAGIAGFVFFADVKYCSSRDTTITGAANGGGIAGISYGLISNCYSTCSPTALLSTGRGGIAGKNLEGGRIECCWCTYASVRGTSTNATEVNYETGVDSDHSKDDFDIDVFDPAYWNLKNGTNTVFKATVTYQF